MNKLNILVVEDELGIVRVLERTLTATGAAVRIAWNGREALACLKVDKYDVVLCDLGLPDLDGHELVAKIREDSDIPIIVLSARADEQDRIKALDAGADDFVAKPFSAGELLARIRAAVRRRSPTRGARRIRFGELEVDLDRRRVVLHGQEISLSVREHSLLTLLAQSVDGIATHRQIIERVWGREASAETQSVRVLVGQLRQKLEQDPSTPRILRTEPGVGYRLTKAD
ncbi:response regulator transcription factor [Sphingomonas sp. BN140010]|uniref:Response regulator transcription factor n=1 Tax=Sphingomonas arvum TaxID=2992113 RepID=A0ABT3JFR7_9SPHN|nr:response regulator transcription factor [Sphingomonas sp. BN140010]MCW3797620.1 response regulator transcription factor [Sphingomonas sp. BN140010]